MRTLGCPGCHGQRLNAQARHVRLTTQHPRYAEQPSRSLPEVCRLAVRDAVEFFQEMRLNETEALIAAEVLKEIRGRLGFLLNVGLDYLTLERTAPTLSGASPNAFAWRARSAPGWWACSTFSTSLRSGCTPVTTALLDTLRRLRDMGNTVVVVEHDEETMRAADHIIDFGPGPGVRGGQVVAAGSVTTVMRTPGSVTGQFLTGQEQIVVPGARRPAGDKRLTVVGAAHNNLKGVDVSIPLEPLSASPGSPGR